MTQPESLTQPPAPAERGAPATSSAAGGSAATSTAATGPGGRGAAAQGASSGASRSEQAEPFRGVQPPALTLPKGGGAIRGLGEKLVANPVTGTVSVSVPLALSPGRAGFGPQMSLSYDSGSGNGPFGLGWSLDLPAITRKTDKGLPRYHDGNSDAAHADVYVLAGSEDLVPVLAADGTPSADADTEPGYVIQRFRPRVEGLFSRCERWRRTSDGDVHWRSVSRENVLSVYGKDAQSRIADPADPRRVFSWLICETRDGFGNATLYEYVHEDGAGVDVGQVHEANRGERDDQRRQVNAYLKRIRYGNRTSLLDSKGERPRFLSSTQVRQAGWMFEVVFDYDEGHYEPIVPDPALPDPALPAADQLSLVRSAPDAGSTWGVRPDPFSSYRAGFEVRTYRRCQRVLMFHHIPDGSGPGSGYEGLVRSITFAYDDLVDPAAVTVNDELAHDGSSRYASFIQRITQSGYRPDETHATIVRDGIEYPTYVRASLPALEFSYRRTVLDDRVLTLDASSTENLPVGLDGSIYQWVDLDGEGVSGVLTEQAQAWFYKPSRGGGQLGPSQPVVPSPSLSRLGGGRARLLDLAGDGHLDLVLLGDETPGFFERTDEAGWEPFRPFASLPRIDWDDANLRLVDLSGDGHSDVLITRQDSFTWHASLGEDGFGPAGEVHQQGDEERGPRLLLADQAQAVFLADMCGDGLTDLVRVRAGEVCYWPNLGYGRFGAKVSLDNAPWFDHADQFDQRRVRLADIDGSGPTDIIYLGADGVRLYLNQSGNRLSDARPLTSFPHLDNVSTVMAIDLLGNGTGCLVWSSPLLDDAPRPLRYMDLMSGGKPHLLTAMADNLGAETTFDYAPSTRFYLDDKHAGTPWLTRLPFPVQVVERVVTRDRISGNLFITRYAYHDGFFDGVEREFRGFGMVEHWDTAEFSALDADEAVGSGVDETVDPGVDEASHTPPVRTKTWYHTGALRTRDRTAQYYREPGLSDARARAMLLDDTVMPAGLSADEQREACRALRGFVLREEVYGLDGTAKEHHPYTVSERNATVVMLQPRGPNRHAVFLTHAREAISYDYEREPTDPRVGHTLTLAVDEFGNELCSVAIGYGRRAPHPQLSPAEQARQHQILATYTENDVTNVVDTATGYRTPMPAQSRTYELSGLTLAPGSVRVDIAGIAATAASASVIGYEQQATDGVPHKRLIEHVRSYYRRDDLTAALALGGAQALGLPFEQYRLALTPELVAAVYGDRVDDAMLAGDARLVHTEGDGAWWVPSGRAFFSADPTASPAQERDLAREHFFLPRRYRDARHTAAQPAELIVDYDSHDVLVGQTTDAVGNKTTVARHDYRVLQPALVLDPNRNRSAAAFDALGMVVATALMGKATPAPPEGDSLTGLRTDLTQAEIDQLVADPTGPIAETLLGDATTRFVYDVNAYARDPQQRRPAFAATIGREWHVHGQQSIPSVLRPQVSFSYSDGFGREIQKKIQAEPEPAPGGARWVGTGWTVFNNKGNPVRQYEAFFSPTHAFEFDLRVGASMVLLYDPAERLLATLHPNHSWEKLSFDAWRHVTWDVNDTVLIADPAADPDVGAMLGRLPDDEYLPTWHTLRTDPAHAALAGALWPNPLDRAAEREAAQRTAIHAATPTITHLDPLGRTIVTVVHNRMKYGDTPPDDPPVELVHRTRVLLDVEGNQREIVDPAGRVVVRYDYDMLSSRIHEASMDAGERWVLTDVAGEQVCVWDSRGHRLRTAYDAVRRPTHTLLREAGGPELTVTQTIYGEGLPNPESANLRGQVAVRRDQSGVATTEAFDFKGNVVRSRRRFARQYDATLDWSTAVELEDVSYTSLTRYDALNRPVQMVAPHLDEPGATTNVVQPVYNVANLLERVHAWLGHDGEPEQLLAAPTANLDVITQIDYDAKGQRRSISYGNATTTEYEYDPYTFRLVHRLTRRDSSAFPDDCPTPAPAGWPGCAVQNVRYTYDPTGNIIRIRDDAQQTVYFRNSRVEPSADYWYDATYRLIEASGREHLGQVGGAPVPHSYRDSPRIGIPHPGDGQAMGRYIERYTYDLVGNVAQLRHHGTHPAHPGWTRVFSYHEPSLIEPAKPSNRVTSTQVGGVGESYSVGGDGYDAHGNMTRMPQLQTLRWDHHNQLQMTQRQAVNAADADGLAHQGERTWYGYDSGGQRARKVTVRAAGQVKDERVYIAGSEVYRSHGSQALVRETLHIMDGQQRVALVETRTQGTEPGVPATVVRYQIGEHLGSASLELDEHGQVISYEEYAPFGSTSYQATTGQTAAPKRYRYTGKERDEESGFYYHGARYYAPWLARWTVPDPAGLADGLNLYAYTLGNPVVFTDPQGTQRRRQTSPRPQPGTTEGTPADGPRRPAGPAPPRRSGPPMRRRERTTRPPQGGAAPARPDRRLFIIVYGEAGADSHSAGDLFRLAAETHRREIERNAFPGVRGFRPGIDEARVVAIHSVADLRNAIREGNVAYLAYFGHAGVARSGPDVESTPVPERHGAGALWIANGSTPGANLTSRGNPSDRPVTDIARDRFTEGAQIRLFGCRAGLGHPPVARQLADHLRIPVYAYISSGGSLFTTDRDLGHSQRDLTQADINARVGYVPAGTNVWLVPAGRPVGWQRFTAPSRRGGAVIRTPQRRPTR